MSNIKSEVAQAASLIRKDLKAAFQAIKFSVSSSSYSMGDSVRISWTNGPSSEQVNSLVCKYKCGRFDGMTDSYDMSNRRNDIPQTMFIHTDRRISQDMYNEAFNDAKSYLEDWDKLTAIDDCPRWFIDKYNAWRPLDFLRRTLSSQDLTNGYNLSILRKEYGMAA